MMMTKKLLLIGGQVFLAALGCAQTVSLPEPPQVRANTHVVPLTLRAVNENGRDAFAFNGGTVPPVIRAFPGDVLRIDYLNDLPAKSQETCSESLYGYDEPAFSRTHRLAERPTG